MSEKIIEIKKAVIELIARRPGITQNEIAKELKLSARYATKLFDHMLENGEICLN